MNAETFIKTVEESFESRLAVLKSKGQSYSGSADCFANFKRNAERLGMSKYQVLAIYMMKHMDSIVIAIQKNPHAPVDSSEGMDGRITDAINYLELLRGMLKEDSLIK